MEKLKQAIERARTERLARQGTAAATEAAEPADRTSPRAPPRAEWVSKLASRSLDVSWSALYERRVVGGPEATALVDTYRMLRTRVLQRMTDREARTLGITSANPGEGKSLTAVNLAISLAKKSAVVLVDADLRRPSIHTLFDVRSSAGLAECLTGKVGVEDCMFSPGIPGLAVLPGGAPNMNSSELLASPAMVELIETIKRSDPAAVLVFDLPPLLTADDALAFAPHVDAVLLVVEEGRTAPAELERATDLLQGVELLGTVLNKSTQAHSTYYY